VRDQRNCREWRNSLGILGAASDPFERDFRILTRARIRQVSHARRPPDETGPFEAFQLCPIGIGRAITRLRHRAFDPDSSWSELIEGGEGERARSKRNATVKVRIGCRFNYFIINSRILRL